MLYSYNMELRCIFVDFSEAFYSINHNKLWEVLKEQRIESKITRILENIYDEAKAYTKREIFKVKRKVKQGYSLCPKLFNARQ